MSQGIGILLAWLAMAIPPSVVAWQSRDALVAELVARGRLARDPDGYVPGTSRATKLRSRVDEARLPPDLNRAVRRRDRQADIAAVLEQNRDPGVEALHRRSRQWLGTAAVCWVFGPVVAVLVDRSIGAVVADGLPFVGEAGSALAILACWAVVLAFRQRFSEPTPPE